MDKTMNHIEREIRYHDGKRFRTLRKITTSTKRKKCDFCPLSVLYSEIQEHLQEHIKDFVVPCPNPGCDLAVCSPFKMEAHIRTSKTCRKVIKPDCPCDDGDKKYHNLCKCKYYNKCELCDFNATSSRALRSHLSETHEVPTEKNYFCPIDGCEEGFTCKQSVHCHLHGYAHRDSVINPTDQKCSECGTSIKLEEMANHLKTVHEAKEVMTCKECTFCFPSWEALLDHLFVHREDPQCLICYICDDGVQYAFHKSLQHHYFTKHNVGKMLTCEYCSRSFAKLKGLQYHKTRSHSNEASTFIGGKRSSKSASVKNRKFVCEEPGCGKTFPKKRLFREHKLLKHTSGLSSSFKCDVDGCEKEYSKFQTLEEHKEKVHLGIVKEKEKVMCEECGEYFSGHRALSTHKLIHTGERPYQCTYCGQRFRHIGVHKTHVESHEKRGDSFKPNGPMKNVRKRVRREES